MKATKLVLGAVILGSTLLAGCSSNAKIDQLSSDVQTLNICPGEIVGSFKYYIVLIIWKCNHFIGDISNGGQTF